METPENSKTSDIKPDAFNKGNGNVMTHQTTASKQTSRIAFSPIFFDNSGLRGWFLWATGAKYITAGAPVKTDIACKRTEL
jgi:hypothetical protein